MKSGYSYDIQSILVTIVDAKGWVEEGRGLLFVVGYKQSFSKTGNPDLTTTNRIE